MNPWMLTNSLCRNHTMLLAYGHAMPSFLMYCPDSGTFDSIGIGGLRLAPATFVAQGSSVPISREGPPLFKE